MSWNDGVGEETCGKEDQPSSYVGRPESWNTRKDVRESEREAQKTGEEAERERWKKDGRGSSSSPTSIFSFASCSVCPSSRDMHP